MQGFSFDTITQSAATFVGRAWLAVCLTPVAAGGSSAIEETSSRSRQLWSLRPLAVETVDARSGKAASVEAPVRALDAVDLDGDGVLDLICLFADGSLTVHRGNARARYSWLPGDDGAPFAARAVRYRLGGPANWLATGDFDADGTADVAVAARGARELRWFRGDGQGRLIPAPSIAFDGEATAMTAGEVNRRDGLRDLLVGVRTGTGGVRGAVHVFESPAGALRAEPETIALPVAPEHVLSSRIDGETFHAIAAAAGDELWIVSGRDRMREGAAPQPTRFGLPAAVKALVRGHRELGWLALLDDGTLLEHGTNRADGRGGEMPRSVGRLADRGYGPPGRTLLSLRATPSRGGDLLIQNESGFVLARGRTSEAVEPLPELGAAAAILPLRINKDGMDDLVLVGGDGSIATAQSTTGATFAVVNTDDVGTGSLRQAILDANALPGADTIVFVIGSGGVQTIAPLTPLPDITETLTIDATTQPGYSGTPLVQLVGSGVSGSYGLRLVDGSAGSLIRGLALWGWSFSVSLAFSPDSIVEGSYFGIDASGANIGGGSGIGVAISNFSDRASIGGFVQGTGNVFGGLGTGIRADAGALSSIVIIGNIIGADPTATVEYPNGSNVLLVGNFGAGSTGHLIGGNLIAGADFNGVEISGPAMSGVLVQGNLIGTNATGEAALPNSTGVFIQDSRLNLIGGTTPQVANLISGNDSRGVYVSRADYPADLNRIQGNLIGTDFGGSAALPNTEGIEIDAPDTLVGGRVPGAGNRIAGNARNGLELSINAHRASVEGNQIGLGANGTALGNGFNGIFIAGADDVVIGAAGDGTNVISGNHLEGIIVSVGSDNLLIAGNYIGTDPTGSFAVPNHGGIWAVDPSPGLRIGAVGAARNVVSGNNGTGIRLDRTAGTTIEDNWVGIDATGFAALPNTSTGIALVDATETTITGNVIANNSSGISLNGTTPGPTTISANSIVSNVYDGVYDQVGGTLIEQNQILRNGAIGVSVVSGTGTRMRGNKIGGNGFLGIDLGGDFVTSNDPLDADDGPNGLQNFPTLAAASYCAATLNVQGSLESTPSTDIEIEFFRTVACHPSGHGEADPGPLTLARGTTDTGGLAVFSGEIPVSPFLEMGQLTATATDLDAANTSELSMCLPILDERPTDDIVTTWPAETRIEWPAVAGATSFRLYRGDAADLPALWTLEPDSALRWFGPETTTGDVLDEVPAPGEFYWWIVRAQNSCGEGGPGAGDPLGRLHDSAGSVSSCAHDTCTFGAALDAGCDPCVAQICEVDDYCCNDEWDQTCIGEVLSVCGSAACPSNLPTCAHSLCEEGIVLSEGCDEPPLQSSCVEAVCLRDPFCCSSSWDAQCVSEVFSVCGLTCD